MNNNVISVIHNQKIYSLVLDTYQLQIFQDDFKDDNQTYNFSFWLRAIFLFGVQLKINDLPE